jgi:hypothetical protein
LANGTIIINLLYFISIQLIIEQSRKAFIPSELQLPVSEGDREKMSKKPVEIKRTLNERLLPDGRRAIKLRTEERSALQQENMIEMAVAMFLDLEHEHTWDEIATALEISVPTLKKLTKSQAFIDKYNEHFADLGHDPRLKAGQAALVDMLPTAIRELKNLITSAATPPTVKLGAIKEVIRLNGMEPTEGRQSDNAEFASFLKAAGVNVEQANISVQIPEEYQKVIKDYVEGQYHEIPVLETSTNRNTRFVKGEPEE